MPVGSGTQLNSNLPMATLSSTATTKQMFNELLTGTRDQRFWTSCDHAFLQMQFMARQHDSCCHEELLDGDEASNRLLHLLCAILQVHRQHVGISISRLMQTLRHDGILKAPNDPQHENRQKHLVFSALGWLNHLYKPAAIVAEDLFYVETSGEHYPTQPTVALARAQRPVDELLRALGHRIPLPGPTSQVPPSTGNYPDDPEVKFHVSRLNAAVLRSIANVKLVWVDTISAHLDFDPTIPALFLCRCPSFCQSQAAQSSILSLLLSDLYQGPQIPVEKPTVSSLMGEILLSYRLLFGDDRQARKMYKETERQKASIYLPSPGSQGNVGAGATTTTTTTTDPLLDDLCGYKLSTSIWPAALSCAASFRQPVRESDFPLLRGRIAKVNNFVAGIEPSRVSSLWRDRRDLRLWYTIWAVLLIGGITIIQGFVSIALSALQVSIAQEALEMQRLEVYSGQQ